MFPVVFPVVVLLALVTGPLLVRTVDRLVAGYRAEDPEAAPAGGPPGRPSLLAAAVVTVLLAFLWSGGLALTGPRPAAVALVWAGGSALVLGAVDLAVHRLPDRVTGPAVAVVAAGWLADAAVVGSWPALLRALLAALAAFTVAALAATITPEGLGFGDVKLLGLIGLVLGWFGWSVLAAGVLLGLLAGAAGALALLATRRAGWRSAMPFGPPLLVGAALALVFTAPLPAG